VADYFFDTSAIVKRYANEPGSKRVTAIIEDQAHSIYMLNLTNVEFCSALKRKINRNELTESKAKELKDWFEWHYSNEYVVVQLQDQDIDVANELIWSHGLRAYDAIQLATCKAMHELSAEHEGPEIVFVSSDGALVAAAKEEGIGAIDPSLE